MILKQLIKFLESTCSLRASISHGEYSKEINKFGVGFIAI